MTARFARAAILLLAIASGASFAKAQFAHPDLKSGKIVVHKVLILPAQATVTKSGMKGSEGLIEESRIVENALPGLISQALQSKGCTVLDNVLAPAALEKDPDLKYAVADIQGRFETIHAHVEQKPKDVRTGRYTLGDDVANFSPGAAADALVFTRASGVLTTGGKKAFAVVVGGNASDFVVMDITVVDSQTGNILFYTDAISRGNFVGDTGRMGKPIDKSLKQFSCSAPSGKN
ncbi:MAG TPA: hypothetical protein VN822_08890 [Candidatus Acidoferrales bacterium]|nr:hypothetical protein [Candidatus Acidoferrales bacterium]